VSEPRKATDVLLSIEEKLERLIGLLTHKELSDKIISNKLNTLMDSLSKIPASPPVFTAEAVDAHPQSIKIEADAALPMSSAPATNGFSRTSRPETFAGDNAYLNKLPIKEPVTRMPVQIPKGDHVEIVVPQEAINLNKTVEAKINIPPATVNKNNGNTISVIQRVVDKNGKSVFLAEIDIIDPTTVEVIQKLKTNGAGKWMTSLPVGQYSVIVKKRDPITKEKVEVTQSIKIDGAVNPLDLPVMIIKQ
jgi:hypothetical protein